MSMLAKWLVLMVRWRIGDAKESLTDFSYQRLNVKNDTYMCRQVRQWLSLWAKTALAMA